MKSTAFPLLLVAVGFAGLAGWQMWEATRLREQISSLRVERDALRKTASLKVGSLVDSDSFESGPKGLELDTSEEGRDVAGRNDKGGTPGQKPDAKVFSNPVTQLLKLEEEIRSKSRAQDKLEFEPLFSLMNCPEEQRSAFYKVREDNEIQILRLAEKLPAPTTEEAERQRCRQDIASAQVAALAQMKETLGSGWARMEAYLQDGPERHQMRGLRSVLAENGLTLSDELEDKLMEVMRQERERFKYTVDLAQPLVPLAAAYDPLALASYMAEQRSLYRLIQKAAEGLLSADQQSALARAHSSLMLSLEEKAALISPPNEVRD